MGIVGIILVSLFVGGFCVYRVIKAETGFLKTVKTFFNW